MWPVIVNIPMPFGWKPLAIPAFGLMVVIAFLAAVGLMRRLVKREGVDPAKVEPLFTIILLGAVVGGRLFHVLTNLDDFKGHWLDVIRIDKGGMVMYGGLLAVVIGGLWYLAAARLPIWKIADVGAICGALGLGIGRIGCVLAGCDYGKEVPSSFPLAVKFPSATQPGSFFGLAVPPNKTHLAPDDHWVHPTQVYQSLCGFLTALILYFLWRRRRFPGQVFAAFLVLKPAYRFVIEYLRGDADRGVFQVGSFTLSQAQIIGVLVAAFGVGLWVVLARRNRNTVAPFKATEAITGPK
jgi:phosphatidylglycerol:prolipoprotein diacylglycerol transferase